MKLIVLTPTEVSLVEDVRKVTAEGENGWFCVLPRHIDFVSSLVPGILTLEPDGRPPEYVALDGGIMVKCGVELSVSTRSAVRGVALGTLRQTVETHFRRLREKEQAARAFEAKLEADLVRQLLEVEKYA